MFITSYNQCQNSNNFWM